MFALTFGLALAAVASNVQLLIVPTARSSMR